MIKSDADPALQQLRVRVSETNPGMVRTVDVLLGELEADELPPPEVLRAFLAHIQNIGAAALERIERLVIDA